MPRFTRRVPRRTFPILVLLLPLLALAAIGTWYLWSRPRVAFGNRLAGSVAVSVGDAGMDTVPPGQTVTLPLSGPSSRVLEWSLIRPLSANDTPMGEEVRGSAVIPAPRGTVEHRAASRGVAGDYFAPLITNATDEILRIRVNAGLEGAVDCGCGVRPGARRVFIGYYRLYRNSTVEARTADGRTAAFRELGPQVVAPDGTVGLRFEPKDFRGSR